MALLLADKITMFVLWKVSREGRALKEDGVWGGKEDNDHHTESEKYQTVVIEFVFGLTNAQGLTEARVD